MHNTEKVPSFVTANLLTSHFTTYRFAVQITAKVSILLVNSAWQLRSDMWEMAQTCRISSHARAGTFVAG